MAALGQHGRVTVMLVDRLQGVKPDDSLPRKRGVGGPIAKDDSAGKKRATIDVLPTPIVAQVPPAKNKLVTTLSTFSRPLVLLAFRLQGSSYRTLPGIAFAELPID